MSLVRLVEARIERAAPSPVLGGANPHSAQELLESAETFARTLPPSQYLLNHCDGRFAFMTALLAAELSGRGTLLWPGDRDAARLQQHYPDTFTVDDQAVAHSSQRHPDAESSNTAGDVLAFTSGTTGESVANVKSLASLAEVAQIIVAAMPGNLRESGSIVSTVPSWHMYGLEWNALLTMASELTLDPSFSLFPKDVMDTLAAAQRPTVLVTTPIHLRALVRAHVSWPRVDLIVSATSPLTPALAESAVERSQGQLLEIYGCTEAGTLARRFPLESSIWEVLPAFTASKQTSGVSITARHLQQPVPLADDIELIDAHQFTMQGRANDLIKVGGKRESLAALNQALLGIPGIEDGIYDFDERTGRLRAAVVSKCFDREQIRSQLRQHMDAVFLPRPLRHVDQLPRNAAGKLSQDSLAKLFDG